MSETISTWKQREVERFQNGTYKALPVVLDYPADHFVHLSTTATESDYVAYTPTEAMGIADRQTRLKFGRYLRKTFSGLSDAEIQQYVTRLKSALDMASNEPKMHFATDVETIDRIFETKMNACGSTACSCMYGKFDGTVRPYHVYANSPDVAVAYVTTDEGIVSRSVVSTKDKAWIRCYSIAGGDNDTDCGTLKRLLEDAGYSSGDLDGNRLTKLPTRRVMLPYIDHGGRHVRDDGDYWTVVDDGQGDYEANCTDGTAEPSGPRCSCCGDREDECECYTCECCGDISRDGNCECCLMCEDCECCVQHGGCDCVRCGDCDQNTDRCQRDRGRSHG